VAGFDDFVTLLSCKDFRRDDLGVSAPTLYRYIDALREKIEKGGWFAKHMSFRHPVGVRNIVARFRDKELARKLASLPLKRLGNKYLEEMGIPLAWYTEVIDIVAGGQIIISWYLPNGVDPGEIYGRYERRGEVFYAFKIPVYTCRPNPGPEDIPVLGKTARRLLSLAHTRLRLRTPLIAYVIMAILDRLKLITINEMAKIPAALKARDIEDVITTSEDFRKKYIMKYYNLLSENMVVGRYRVVKKDFIWRSVTMLLESRPDDLEEVYGFLATTGSAAHMYVSENTLVATIRLDYGMVLRYRGLLQELGTVYLATRVLSYPFPYELYDPVSDAWRRHPVEKVTELFRKLGLVKR